MELMIPAHNMDFQFSSARINSPYTSAPSTHRRFGECYYSAPPSPSRITEFFDEFDDDFIDIHFDIGHNDPSEGAFEWGINSRTRIPSKAYTRNGSDHFEFDLKEVEGGSVSAEELFDGGMIKPSRTPPHLPKLPGARHGESLAQKSKKEINPFTPDSQKTSKFTSERERGRERVQNLASSSRRSTRSLSPLRTFRYLGDQEEKEILQSQKQPTAVEKSSSSSSSSSGSSKGQKKWRFKDLFLFRNASDGRASDKDVLRKYRATLGANERAAAGSNARRKGPVSAHELLYTENRAARENLKKKSFLPYKGVWGRMPFNAALANGLGFSH